MFRIISISILTSFILIVSSCSGDRAAQKKNNFKENCSKYSSLIILSDFTDQDVKNIKIIEKTASVDKLLNSHTKHYIW